MDYTKYLNCKHCKEYGLYCKKHRIEVERELKKNEMQKMLQITNRSQEYKKSIKNLLESYNVWSTQA